MARRSTSSADRGSPPITSRSSATLDDPIVPQVPGASSEVPGRAGRDLAQDDRRDVRAARRAARGSFRSAYQPALDGLRAVCVLMVLCFHAGMGWMPGGYLGVSVFFTLSGYLITGLLLREYDRTARVRLGPFVARRVARLAPAGALCVVLVLVARALGAFAMVPHLERDALGAVLQVSNWVQLGSGASYADLFAGGNVHVTSPFDHYWSLAIEEQFYWVWPVVLWLVLRRWGSSRSGVFGAVLLITACFAVAAPLTAVWFGPDAAYWATPARLAEILVGAALACWLHVARRRAAPRAFARMAGGARPRRARGRAAVRRRLRVLGRPPARGADQRGVGVVAAGAEHRPPSALGGPAARAGAGELRPVPVPLAGRRAAARARLGSRVAGRVRVRHRCRARPRDRLVPARGGARPPARVASVAASSPPGSRSPAWWRRAARSSSQRRCRSCDQDEDLLAASAIVADADLQPLAPATTAPPTTVPATTTTVSPRGAQPRRVDAADHGPDRGVRAPATTTAEPAVADRTTVPSTSTGVVPADTSMSLPAPPNRPVRVLVVGDSTALYLGQGLAAWSLDHPEYAQVAIHWCQGCGFLLDGTITSFDGARYVADSKRVVEQEVPALVAELQPDIVVLMSTVDDVASRAWDDDEGSLDPTDPRFAARLTAAYGDLTDRVLAMGVPSVAWVVPPTPTAQWADDPGMRDPERWEAQHRVIRAVVDAAAARDERVSSIDLDGWFDATGRSGDATLRPDGVHLTDASARLVADLFAGPSVVQAALATAGS